MRKTATHRQLNSETAPVPCMLTLKCIADHVDADVATVSIHI
jgi:hypothetical protein